MRGILRSTVLKSKLSYVKKLLTWSTIVAKVAAKFNSQKILLEFQGYYLLEKVLTWSLRSLRYILESHLTIGNIWHPYSTCFSIISDLMGERIFSAEINNSPGNQTAMPYERRHAQLRSLQPI
jgi:hypothetical protein